MMNNADFDQEVYLTRIGFKGEPTVSLESLRDLHLKQLFTIPFENFDIVLGKGIDLTPSNLFNKLVHNHRGGYCFELNGLFLMALQNFGFHARGLLGRVHASGTPSSKSHQFTLVHLDGERWITDVGFGKGTMQNPIPLIFNQPISVFHQLFRFVESPLYGIMLQTMFEGEWHDEYSFTLQHIFPNDILMGNYYTSTSPDSYFVKSRVAALPTEHGTNTLRNFLLKKASSNSEIEETLKDDQSYIEALDQYFGIKLDATIGDFRPVSE